MRPQRPDHELDNAPTPEDVERILELYDGTESLLRRVLTVADEQDRLQAEFSYFLVEYLMKNVEMIPPAQRLQNHSVREIFSKAYQRLGMMYVVEKTYDA